jgi:hypothetical protein
MDEREWWDFPALRAETNRAWKKADRMGVPETVKARAAFLSGNIRGIVAMELANRYCKAAATERLRDDKGSQPSRRDRKRDDDAWLWEAAEKAWQRQNPA